MATETLQRREVLRLQLLATTASTANDADRTIELVVATETPVNDLVLRCQPGSVQYGPAPVPVLMNHANHTGEMAGRLLSIRFEGGQLIALAQFTDAPAADAGWALARAGTAVSVGASYSQEAIKPGRAGNPDVVTVWRLREASLVAVGADPMATTRAAAPIQNNAPEGRLMSTNNNTLDREELTLDRVERKRCTEILDCARKLKVSEALAHQLIADGVALDEARMQLIDAKATAEQRTPGIARSWEPGDEAHQTPLQRHLDAAIVRGEQIDFHDVVRSCGGRGRTAIERVQSLMLQRGMQTTSDLPLSLLSSMDTRLQQVFPSYSGGILTAADVRPLSDFREYGLVDAGLVGTAKKINEGGEVNYTSIQEAALKAKPSRYGHALAWSVEAQSNDGFLGALRQGVDELGFGASDAEKIELVNLLEGSATGGTCADGQALFHASHKNSVSAGPIGIDKLGQAVALLRGQKSVGGRFIDQQPATILCGTAAELTIRQLLSTAVVPNSQNAVNPWASLINVEVEPRLGDTFCYLISAGPRKPLELGRLYPAPQISSMVDFETGAFKAKAEHAFGTAVSEFRAIVRVKLAA